MCWLRTCLQKCMSLLSMIASTAVLSTAVAASSIAVTRRALDPRALSEFRHARSFGVLALLPYMIVSITNAALSTAVVANNKQSFDSVCTGHNCTSKASGACCCQLSLDGLGTQVHITFLSPNFGPLDATKFGVEILRILISWVCITEILLHIGQKKGPRYSWPCTISSYIISGVSSICMCPQTETELAYDHWPHIGGVQILKFFITKWIQISAHKTICFHLLSTIFLPVYCNYNIHNNLHYTQCVMKTLLSFWSQHCSTLHAVKVTYECATHF